MQVNLCASSLLLGLQLAYTSRLPDAVTIAEPNT